MLAAVGTWNSCSSALIDVGGSLADPAYVLTAGHCIDRKLWHPNQVHVQPTAYLGGVQFNVFYDTYEMAHRRQPEPVAAIEYATMHGGDVAVLRLAATVGQLRARNIIPLPLADEVPPPGAVVSVVGFPLGYPLVRNVCRQGHPTRLIEGEFLFNDMAADCPFVRSGSSGSPALTGAGAIFGVVGTGAGSGHPCSLNNPCALDGPPASPESCYATPVQGLKNCFPGGRFDLAAPGCPLIPPPVASISREGGRYTRSRVDGDLARWNVTVHEERIPYYRVKAGPAHLTRCDVAEGYGPLLAIVTAPVISEPLTSGSEGLYVLCVQGGRSPSPDELTPPGAAAALVVEVDDTAPKLPLPVDVAVRTQETVVLFYQRRPEYARLRFRLQAEDDGPCAMTSPDALVEATHEPLVVSNSDPRRVLCVMAEDAAGNTSEFQRLTL